LLVTNKIDEVELRSEKLENQKKEIIDQGNSAKQQILVSFEDLKNRLDKKERELINQIDRTVQDSLRESENFSRLINSKISALENISETLKKVLSEAEQVELLDFYSENQEKLVNSIENELSSLTSIDKSTNLRYVVAPQSLSEHIESIKSVQLQISSFKPLEERRLDRSEREKTAEKLEKLDKSRRSNYKLSS
jgi:pyruvate-formate lyase-activating enzyme